MIRALADEAAAARHAARAGRPLLGGGGEARLRAHGHARPRCGRAHLDSGRPGLGLRRPGPHPPASGSQPRGEHPPVVYSGSLERIDFGEEDEPKGFCWVELSAARGDVAVRPRAGPAVPDASARRARAGRTRPPRPCRPRAPVACRRGGRAAAGSAWRRSDSAAFREREIDAGAGRGLSRLTVAPRGGERSARPLGRSGAGNAHSRCSWLSATSGHGARAAERDPRLLLAKAEELLRDPG